MSSASLCGTSLLCKGPPTQVVVVYTVALMAMYAAYHIVAGREFSAILTFSVMFQCLSMMLLAMQSWTRNSAAGISAQSLVLEALAIGCRMSSTVWLDGYLPMDKTGDFLYQAVDFCSLAIVLWLLHRVLVVQGDSYEASKDTIPVAPIVLGSFLLGIMFHADMNDRPFFDTVWMAGLFLGIAGVVPQLWLITRLNGRIDALTGHYVATMAFARLLSGIFMWHAREDITCEPWVNGINHAPWVILAGHAVHLFLLGNFGYFYGLAVAKQGPTGRLNLNLPSTLMVV